MLKDSLAYAFSYLHRLCVGQHLYEGWDEKREERIIIFLKLREKEREMCVRETGELPQLFFLVEGLLEMLSV